MPTQAILYQSLSVDSETTLPNLLKQQRHSSSLLKMWQFPQPLSVTSSTSIGTYRGLDGGSATNGVYGNRAYIQIRINTTDYFLDPDNVGNDGIPGAASPYPRSTSFQPCFNLYPDVYVLPGQVFDALVTCYQNGAFSTGFTKESSQLYAFMKYTLYDGPDALIANKLLEMGISINPGNVDWYKRTLIQSQSAPMMA